MDSDFFGNTGRDYLRIIFRHKAVIIVTFVGVMMIAFIGAELKTPVYEAQVKMLISAEKMIASPYYKGLTSGPQTDVTATQSAIVNSYPVMERAVKALRLDQQPSGYEKLFCTPLKAGYIDLMHWISQFRPEHKLPDVADLKLSDDTSPDDASPDDASSEIEHLSDSNLSEMEDMLGWVAYLQDKITVEPTKETNLFTITATDFHPVEAARIANVISRSYVIYDQEQQLAELQLEYGENYPDIKELKDNIQQLTKNLAVAKLSNIEAFGPASVKIIEQAFPPMSPKGPGRSAVLLLSFIMSPFLGLVFAFGLEYIDHTFKSPQDVETFLNLPLLGSIPKKGFKDRILIKDSKQMAAFTPSYQNLSDQMYLLMKDKNLKSILVTAPSPLDGSTTILANLANFLSSKAGHKVIVIDANLRAPTIHKLFNVPDNTGLANVLEGKVSLEKAIHELSPNLTVLPAGNTSLNPTPLLDSTRMANVIKAAREKYELVFIDYSNLKSFKDACVLCSYSDGIVLVVSEGKTRRHVLKELLAPLRHKKANMIGVVLNNRTYAIPKIIYERL